MSENAKAVSGDNFNSHVLRLRLIRRFGVPAVDILRFWPIPVLLSSLTILPIFASTEVSHLVTSTYHGLLGLSAFALGLACSNDDLDRGTLWTLRAMPVSSIRLLLQKLASCLLMLMLYLFIAEIVNQAGRLIALDRPDWLFPTLGNFKLATFWNFGVWLPLTLAQLLCLMTLGLASGVVFKNFVYSAVAGLATYVIWYLSWNGILHPMELRGQSQLFHGAMAGQQLALSLGAAMVFVRAVAYPNFFSRFGRNGKTSPQRIERPRRRMLRPPWETHTTPFGGRLLTTTLLTMVAVTVTAVLLIFRHRTAGDYEGYAELIWVLVIIPSSIIGVSVFSREELFADKSLIYYQPVGRSQLLAERLPILTVYCVAASLPAMMLAPGQSQVYYLPLMCLCIGVGLVGALARLFYRNPMFPLVLTLMIGFAWELIYMLLDNRLSRLSETGDVTARFAQQAWFSALVIIVPLAALKLAYQRTALLSLRESARSLLGLSVLYCLGMVVCLLISAQIGELAWLVSHWMASIFGLKTGGAS